MLKNIALVLGEFHRERVMEMLDEARKTAKELGLKIVEEVWVNGSVEKPLALKRLLLREDVDGAIALGIIERGETKHGLVMGTAIMEAVTWNLRLTGKKLAIEAKKPFAILGEWSRFPSWSHFLNDD